MEISCELFSYAINLAFAVAIVQNTSLAVFDARADLAATRQESIHGDRLMSGRLVDDGCFVSGLMNRDDSVNSVSVDNLLLNDWLSDVVNVMLNIFVNALAEVNNSAFLGSVLFRVLVLRSETLEKTTVFLG